jgi:hypothetical protein
MPITAERGHNRTREGHVQQRSDSTQTHGPANKIPFVDLSGTQPNTFLGEPVVSKHIELWVVGIWTQENGCDPIVILYVAEKRHVAYVCDA